MPDVCFIMSKHSSLIHYINSKLFNTDQISTLVTMIPVCWLPSMSPIFIFVYNILEKKKTIKYLTSPEHKKKNEYDT